LKECDGVQEEKKCPQLNTLTFQKEKIVKETIGEIRYDIIVESIRLLGLLHHRRLQDLVRVDFEPRFFHQLQIPSSGPLQVFLRFLLLLMCFLALAFVLVFELALFAAAPPPFFFFFFFPVAVVVAVVVACG